MGEQRLGIVMNGVTGRMGTNQHLIRSIAAIRAQGGVTLENGDRVMPDPILVGRSEEKVAALAEAHGLSRWTTNLAKALADRNDTVFFDAATTQMRPALLAKAIDAGKHIYCEKPVATNLEEAMGIMRKARAAGIKHGVVQDKLFLPGLRKLKMMIDSGFFGRRSPCAASSATGCSRATCSRRSGRPGITAAKMAAASFSTWSATGATCSTTPSAR
jgi:predicted dehydrogenase